LTGEHPVSGFWLDIGRYITDPDLEKGLPVGGPFSVGAGDTGGVGV
jgi:hypothetical protein